MLDTPSDTDVRSVVVWCRVEPENERLLPCGTALEVKSVVSDTSSLILVRAERQGSVSDSSGGAVGVFCQCMIGQDLLMVTLKQTDHVSPALPPAPTLWTFYLECDVPSNHTLPRIALFRTLRLPALAVSAHRS